MEKPLAPEHLRFAVLAVDVVLFTIKDGQLLVRLAPVHRIPHYPDSKAMPGGLIHPDETARMAALRILTQKGHIDAKTPHIEQLYTFSDIDRDPRGRVVSVAYLGLASWDTLSTEEKADTESAWWAPLAAAKKLAYDHDEILKLAVERLQSRVTYTTLLSKFMPKEFTLTELEQSFESIIKTDLDKRNFRKKILKLGILTDLGKKRTGGRSRPAALYKFKSSTVVPIEVI
jgi:8-oxo-dGTP diphosphatase